jgi:ketosteroid isomerase-like protein
MSTEAEQVVRDAIDAWNERDLDRLVALSREDIVYVNPPEALEPGTRRGHDEFKQVARKQWEFLGDASQRVDRVYERGGAIITEIIASRRMSGSGVPIQNRLLLRWTIRAGLIERLEVLGGGSAFEDARREAGLD